MNRIFAGFAAAALMFGVVGCQNTKKVPEPNAVADNTPAPAPVPYQPAPSAAPAPTAAVTATPTEGATAAAMSENGTATVSTTSITGSKYTIKAGDNLYSIAKKRYGSGNSYKKILAANPGLNENRLVPGKTIVLP